MIMQVHAREHTQKFWCTWRDLRHRSADGERGEKEGAVELAGSAGSTVDLAK